MKESELYPHVKTFFEDLDYEVKAEILDCDVMAVRDEQIIVTEMKTSLNLTLLGQAVERQLLYDIVYIAVPKPTFNKRYSNQQKRAIKVVKRLGLGLLYIDFNGEGMCIEEFPPANFKEGIRKSRRTKLREKAISEFGGLSGDYNVGGTTGIKKMTAYRECALTIAMYLDIFGPAKASTMKKYGCGANTWNILYRNHYGWFQKKEKAIYELTEEGRRALKEYSHVCVNINKTMFSDV